MLYKYRGGDEAIFQRDLASLKENYFFAPSYKKLNDPCETMILSNKVDWITNSLTSIFGGGRAIQEDLRDITQDVISTKKNLGIYSLSNNVTNELMWAHYANKHEGFCLEFEKSELLENNFNQKLRLIKVNYSNRLPKLSLVDMNNDDRLIKKFVGTKSRSWSYEEEIRIISNKFGKIHYRQSALKSIYFGLRMSDKHKTKITNALEGRDIQYFQINQEKTTYAFNVSKFIA